MSGHIVYSQLGRTNNHALPAECGWLLGREQKEKPCARKRKVRFGFPFGKPGPAGAPRVQWPLEKRQIPKGLTPLFLHQTLEAFKAGQLPNSMDDDRYINVKTVKQLALR